MPTFQQNQKANKKLHNKKMNYLLKVIVMHWIKNLIRRLKHEKV